MYFIKYIIRIFLIHVFYKIYYKFIWW
jgi:hypothetical protein